jgi:hypothetical protein
LLRCFVYDAVALIYALPFLIFKAGGLNGLGWALASWRKSRVEFQTTLATRRGPNNIFHFHRFIRVAPASESILHGLEKPGSFKLPALKVAATWDRIYQGRF